MLMGADHGTIDKVDGPIELILGVGVSLEGRQDAIPDARLTPAIEATGDGFPWPIALGHIPPWRPGPQNPDDTVDDRPMVMIGSAGIRFLRWKQRFEPLPLRRR